MDNRRSDAADPDSTGYGARLGWVFTNGYSNDEAVVLGLRGDYADILSGPDVVTDLFAEKSPWINGADILPHSLLKIRLQGDVISSELSDSSPMAVFCKLRSSRVRMSSSVLVFIYSD